jgi:hypothetical protein
VCGCVWVQVADQLAQFLPESQRGRGDLVALAHSPQFHQQLQTFSAALQTGQLDLGQFGLRAAVGGAGWGAHLGLPLFRVVPVL